LLAEAADCQHVPGFGIARLYIGPESGELQTLWLIKELRNRTGTSDYARITRRQCLLDIPTQGDICALAMAGKLGQQ
jgi:hypothetical protein